MPSLHTTHQGIACGFDTDKQKFFVEMGGKRSYSQDFEVLQKKIEAHQKQAPAAQESRYEATVLAFTGGDRSVPVPTKIIMGWDPQQEKLVVHKYRVLKDGQSWREFQSDTLEILDPGLSNPLRKQHRANETFDSMVNESSRVVFRTLIEAWRDRKSDQTVRLVCDRRGAHPFEDRPQTRYNSDDNRFNLKFLENAPRKFVDEQKETGTLDDWTETESGHWEHRDGRLRLRVEFSRHTPQFALEETVDGVVVSLFSGQNLPLVLQLAEAMQHMLPASEAQRSWEVSYSGVTDRNGKPKWPTEVETRGYLVVTAAPGMDDGTALFSLIRHTDHPINPTGGVSSEQQRQWHWAETKGRYITSPMDNHVNVGPEDDLLVVCQHLRAQTKQTLRNELTGEQKSEMRATDRSNVLSHVHEAHLNGEWEDPTPEALMAAWNRFEQRILREVKQDENLIQWQAHCEQSKQNALKDLESKNSRQSKKVPKP